MRISGVTIGGECLLVLPYTLPFIQIIVSGVLLFIPNNLLEKELQYFGKLASGFKTVGGDCKYDKTHKLKHVIFSRKQVFMFFKSATQMLRVKYEEGFYMVYMSTGNMKCFECGDVWLKWTTCPSKRSTG